MQRPKLLLAILLICLLSALSACGGSSQPGIDRADEGAASGSPRQSLPMQPAGEPGHASSQRSTPAAAPEAAGGLKLPTPAQLTRRSSFTQAQGHLSGAEFDSSLPSGGLTVIDPSIDFAPSFSSGGPLSDLAYAVWHFNLPSSKPTAAVSFDWNPAPQAANTFFGLANFSSNRWDWFSPADAQALNLDDVSPYLNGSDDLYLAIALVGAELSSLNGIQFLGTAPPTADLQVDFSSGLAPLDVTFDASASSDSDGAIITWEWDFDGDGVFGEAGNGELAANNMPVPAAVTYPDPGIYSASIRVTDNEGASAVASVPIDVNGAPTVSLGATPAAGNPPFDVTFDAQATDDGSIVNYEWDFDGDGIFGELANGEAPAGGNPAPTATYTDAGQFNATVRVTDDKNAKATGSTTINSGGQPTVTLNLSTMIGNKPLFVNFSTNTTDDGSIVDYEWDFDGDGNFNEADNGEDSAQGNASTSHIYTQTGTFTPAVRVTDNDSNQASDSKNLTVNNSPPTAAVTATPPSGSAPLVVDFDASGSTDFGGSIADYEWDFDGDSVFNESGDEANNQGEVQPTGISFNSSGTYLVTLRVTDDDGATDTAQTQVIVSSWTIVPLATGANNDGTNASMALINGNPAVVWRRSGPTASLRYMTSTTATGGAFADWTSQQLIVTADAGQFGTSLAEVGGRAAVTFMNATDSTFRFARQDSTGSGWSGPGGANVVIDNAANSGRYSSLKMVGSNPAVGYTDFSNGNAMYVRSTSSTGATGSWGNKVTVFDGTIVAYSDMEMVNGNPAMTFCDNTNQILRFIRATSTDGALAGDWPGTALCDVSSGILAIDCAITTANGNPGIGYIDANSDVRFARCSTSTGAATADWTTGTNVPVANQFTTSYQYSRVNFLLGKPVFAYSDITNNNLYYSTSSNANGDNQALWGEELVDGASTQMIEPSNIILLSTGQPALCYHDVDNDDLIYAFRN